MMKVKDLILNDNFDFNANYFIFDCTAGNTYDESPLVFSSISKDPPQYIQEMEISCITINNDTLYIEGRRNINGMSIDDALNKLEISSYNVEFVNTYGVVDRVQIDAHSSEELEDAWHDHYDEYDADENSVLYVNPIMKRY